MGEGKKRRGASLESNIKQMQQREKYPPHKGCDFPEVTTDSAAALLQETKHTRRNGMAVMTTLHGHGGVTSASMQSAYS